MAVFKATQNRSDSVGKFKATEKRSYDSSLVSQWEASSKESYDVLEKYRMRINMGGFLSSDDLTAYRSALDTYKESASNLRRISKTFGQGGVEDDDQWNESLSQMESGYKGISDYYSQWKNEADFKVAMEQVKANEKRLKELTGGYDPAKNQQEGKAGWEAYMAQQEKYAQMNQEAMSAQEDPKWWEQLLKYIGDIGSDTSLPGIGGSQVAAMSKEAQQKDLSLRSPDERWTDEQRETFGYLWNTDRPKANEYAFAINSMLDKQAEDAQIKDIQESATGNFFAGAGHTLGAIAAAPLGLADYLGDLIYQGAVGYVPQADGEITPFEYSQAVTGGVSQHLNESGGTLNENIPIIGGKGWGDVYGLGTSLAQSSLAAYSGGSGQALITFFGSAAASGVDDALSRGASGEQAIAYGTLSGLAEGLAENVGVDNLLNIGASNTMRQLVMNILKQGAAEGLEEGATTLMNNFADQLVMQDKSRFSALVQRHMLMGLSESDAKKQAWMDMANDLAFDMVSGFASGAIHAGPQTAYQTYLTGNEMKANYGGSQQELVGEALEIDPNNAFAQKMQGKLDKGKNLSGGQLAQLVDQKTAAITAQDMTSIQSATESRLTELGETGDISTIAAALTKQAAGEKLSRAEQQAIANSKYGQRVSNELNPKNIRSGDYSSAWDEQIDTNSINAQEYSRLVEDAQMPQEDTEVPGEQVAAVSPKTAQDQQATPVENSEATFRESRTVAEDGVTRQVSTGQAVEPKKIVSIDGGKAMIQTDGGTVAADDIEFGDGNTDLLWRSAISFNGITPASANGVIRAYRSEDNVTTYLKGAAQEFRNGYYNMDSGGEYADKLTPAQREIIYELGQKAAGENTARAQAKATEAKKVAVSKKEITTSRQGKVHFDRNGRTFDAVRETALKTMEQLSAALGVEFHVFESYKNSAGELVYKNANGNEIKAPNGYYDPKDGSIHIDLNAGADGKGTMLFTIAHELTHFIKQWSPAKFKVLANVLMKQYAGNHISVNELVDKQINKAQKNGRELSWEDAYEEMVADSMEAMLTDGNIVQFMAEVKQQDKTLWQKIFDWFKDLVADLKAVVEAYKGYKPDSQEGRMIADMQEAMVILESFYADALLDAGENYQAAGEQKNTTRKGGEKYSFAGQNSENADHGTLDRAKAMQEQGMDNETIRQETGWFRGMDGKWRYEIDDSKMEIAENLSNYMRLGDMMQHEGLYAAYPDLADIDVVFQSLEAGVNGSYNTQFDSINLNYKLKNDPFGLKDALAHELQHAIQNREGFTKGATVESWERKKRQGFDSRRAEDRRKALETERELRRIQDEEPEFYRDMLELESMTPNVPRGEIDWDTLEKIEDDPVEWQLYDARREELEAKYGDMKVWDANDLLYQRTRAAQDMGRSGTELYFDTAGEIEARDTANRRTKTQEQRKTTPPRLGNEDTVFAEGTGQSDQAIGKTVNNKPFVIVERDILDGVAPSDWVRIVTQNIRNKFPNGVTIGRNNIAINQKSRRELTYSEYMHRIKRDDPQLYSDKLRATDNLDEIIQATTDWINEGLKHGRSDNIQDFARGTVLIRIGSNDYSAEVVVGTKTNGTMLLYDIMHLQKTSISDKKTDASVTSESRNDSTDRQLASPEEAPLITGTHNVGEAGGATSTVSINRRILDVKRKNDRQNYFDKKPTNDADIRYSERDPELERVNRVLTKENAELKYDIAYLKELLKLQKQATGGTKFTRTSVEAASGQLIKYANAKGEKKELASLLNGVYEYIAKGEALTWEGVKEAAQPAVDWLHSHMGADKQPDGYSYDEELLGQDLLRQVYDSYWDVSTLYTVADKAQKEINRLKYEHSKRMSDLREYHKEKVAQLKSEHREALQRVKQVERERSERKQQEIAERYQEAREKSRENRQKAQMRQKIRRTIMDLDKLLNRGNKKLNVKEDMKGFASKALELADYLFTDHISNDDLIRRGITVRMTPKEAALVKETENILSQLYDHADSLTDEEFTLLDAKRKANEEKLRDLLTAQRNERLNTPVYNLFNDLVTEYASLKNSKQNAVKAAYNEELEKSLRAFISDDDRVKILKNMRVADMTTEELNWLYRAYTMVLTNVRNANKFFAKGVTESIDKVATQIVMDFGSRKIPDKKLAIAAQKIANKIGWDYEKLYYALDRIGSDAFTKLIMNIADSENTVMQDIMEAVAFRDQIVEKYGFNNWDVNKKIDREFLDNTGKKFTMTLGQLMSLYAYSRRKGAWDHIEYGGFVFGEKALTDPKPADSYKLSKEQCEAITSLLTNEQKSYVEDMQKFLSETMGEKGNEVSMLLYGIKMFGEKNYFPIHIAGQFKAQANESQAKQAAGFGSMSNAGFTHAQNPNAKAPFVLEGFNEVWSDHVNEMSRYHGTVPALEDLRRVMNRSSYFESTAESTSVKVVMENHFGEEAVKYFDNLYREANSGATMEKLEKWPKKLLTLFRKNSVAYSLSVLIQQPASIVRAYTMIDKKYFGYKGFGTITSGVAKAISDKWTKAHTNAYNEMLKYAPGVTMAKEIGGFDTATGGNIRSYLLDTGKSFRQKVKTDKNGKVIGTVKAGLDFVDDNAIANLPNVADKIAWIEIWNACKRETVATHKDLAPTSEEFMQIVGERFTEVIRATQVYDSIFAKSPMLKSKHLAVQYLVSFMNEANTVANMAESAVRDAIRGDWKKGAKRAAVVAYSIIFTNVLKSIIYAMRDDDEDETYTEKYVESIVGGVMNDLNSLNYIPLVRDVWSIAQGYDVERADMAIVADFMDAIEKVNKYKNTETDGMTEEQLIELEKKQTEANWKLVESLAAFFGIPVKNIRKEVNGVFDHIRIASANAGMTTADSAWNKVHDAVMDSLPEFLATKATKNDKLYDAIVSGDKAYLDRLKSTYKTDSAYQTAVRKALRENDPRIHEAAQAKVDGNFDVYRKLLSQIQGEGKFDNNDIISAIKSEESEIRKAK